MTDLMFLNEPLVDLVHPNWLPCFETQKENFDKVSDFLEGKPFLPQKENILRAFRLDPLTVKVLLVGQDPYPTPGHAVGLSFSVSESTKPLPRSLNNIFKELSSDLDTPTPSNGDLTPWFEQGVMLLNRVLTVSPGEAGSHQKKGWEEITFAAASYLSSLNNPPVALLWGAHAQTLTPLFASNVTSVHPSPLSARRGFFGSKPFTQVNELLQAKGLEPVNWALS